MIVIDWMDLIFLAIFAVFLVICGIGFVIDRIVHTIKKRQQKRIDNAFREEGE